MKDPLDILSGDVITLKKGKKYLKGKIMIIDLDCSLTHCRVVSCRLVSTRGVRPGVSRGQQSPCPQGLTLTTSSTAHRLLKWCCPPTPTWFLLKKHTCTSHIHGPPLRC